MSETNDTTVQPSPSSSLALGDSLLRQRAVKQLERKRRFVFTTALAAMGMALLVAIWATSEYHNAGGWPTQGFSQSSGIHHVWNVWIIYPAIAWVLGTAAHAWSLYMHKPISEREVDRQMQRQARAL